MRFLRLGTKCAVINADGRILLSKRDDLKVWNLPGGRLDAGEPVDEAAAREVMEETGISAHITHPIGLYYWQHWGRMNILFAAKPAGGKLLQKTDETEANQYFAPADFPHALIGLDDVAQMLDGVHPLPQIISLPRLEFWQTKLRLHWRWVKNLLNGRREPRFARFDVRAAALIYSDDHQRILTLPNDRMRVLPRTLCDGRAAPWVQLQNLLQSHIDKEFPASSNLRWAGLWQDPITDSLEFIFAATLPQETELSNGAIWSQAQNAPLTGKDAAYLARVEADYSTTPVWMLIPQPTHHVIINAQRTDKVISEK
jgi:8-oxo-dGTP pyrophosphatase MutT (NUDIX family)